MAALERIADVLEEVFRAARIECLLSPKAVVQIAQNRKNRRAAYGHNRTSHFLFFLRDTESVGIDDAD